MKFKNYILISIFLFSCKQKDKQTFIQTPTFQLYGIEAAIANIDDVNKIALKHGFQFKIVADCTVTDSLVNASNSNNLKMSEIMNERFGKNWKKKFEKEIGFEVNIHTN